VLRRVVCDIQPEWPAGILLQYHGLSAHWVIPLGLPDAPALGGEH